MCVPQHLPPRQPGPPCHLQRGQLLGGPGQPAIKALPLLCQRLPRRLGLLQPRSQGVALRLQGLLWFCYMSRGAVSGLPTAGSQQPGQAADFSHPAAALQA